MSATRSFWRCTKCGRWSTAQRRPSRHKRRVGDEYDLHDLGLRPEEAAESAYYMEPDTGAYVDVYWIWCGPFEEWTAVRKA